MPDNSTLPPLVFVADGIGTTEERTSNVVDYVVKGIESTLKVQAMWVQWSAGYGPIGGTGRSWQNNADAGSLTLLDMIDKNAGRKFILLGYSGGCLVIRKALERLAPHHHGAILAVGLLSDPFRPSDKVQSGIMETTGSGVCGGKYTGVFTGRTFWTTHPLDPISNADPDALLRTVADFTDNLGTDLQAFTRDVAETLNSRTLQLWRERALFARNPIHWFQTIGDRVTRAARDVMNYSVRGYHTTGYTDPWADGPSLAFRLGASISWRARKELGIV